MSEPLVLVESVDGIAWITLNRPHKLNALTRQMVVETLNHVDRLGDDDDVRVIVLMGAGRAFCAGADLGDVLGAKAASGYPGAGSTHTAVQRLTQRIMALDKPVVAAINGLAVGGGFELSLACDIRIASESSYFLEAAMQHGLIPGDGSVLTLPRLVGHGRAFEILFDGERLSAKEAERIGLVSKVVADDELVDYVNTRVRKWAELKPDAVAMLKQAIRLSASGSDVRGVFDFLRVGVAYGKVLRLAD